MGSNYLSMPWYPLLAQHSSYTACQLSGITLLVLPFCLTAGENLYQCQYKAIDNIWKTSRGPLIKFYCRPSTAVLSRSAFFLGSAAVLQLFHMQLGAFMLITFSCEPSPNANYHPKPSGNHANQYPACNYWKYRSVLTSWSSKERCRE